MSLAGRTLLMTGGIQRDLVVPRHVDPRIDGAATDPSIPSGDRGQTSPSPACDHATEASPFP